MVFTVKVQNLSKSTNKYSILSKVPIIVSVDDIFVRQCPDAPTNYAYVNCLSLGTAREVARILNDSILDNNKVSAKVKGEEYSSRQNYPTFTSGDRSTSSTERSHSRSRSRSPVLRPWQKGSSRGARNQHKPGQAVGVCKSDSSRGAGGTDCGRPTSSNNTRTVKVSMHGSGVTETDLYDFFSMYGTLASRIILRPGQPDYAFVNFKTDAAAKAACNSSTHCIKGTLVTVGPKTSKMVVSNCQDGLGVQLATTPVALPCSPLVIDKAHKEMARHFEDSKVMKIEPAVDRIVVHLPQVITESATAVFKRIIQATEAKIKAIEVPLNFCYCPVLAVENTARELSELEKKFDLEVELYGKRIFLEQFHSEWNKQEGELASQMDQSTSFETESTYHWYWFDDDTYRPYGSTANKQIEAAFQSNSEVVLSIHSKRYIINTANKQQTNPTTGKIRSIQRRQLRCLQSSNVILHLKSHEDHIQEVKKCVLSKLDSFIYENKVCLPDSLRDIVPFVQGLLHLPTKRFVQAAVDEDGSHIVLRGIRKQVYLCVREMLTMILGKERELGRTSSISLPTTWTPQEGNCELKMVPTGSLEWADIERLFLQPNFDAQIMRIERIQNKWLWEAYVQARDRMFSKNGGDVNEKQLFHGTRKTPPKAVYNSEQGFDNRLASQGLYGEGTYFAMKSSYSHNYAHSLDNGCSQMFLAKVITGISYECRDSNPSLKAPPLKVRQDSSASTRCMFEGERFDSVTAITGGSKIYVVYELGRVYPAYLITYKSLTQRSGHANILGASSFINFFNP